jgi:plasmid stability protein
MADILLRDVPSEMKRQIEDLAHGHKRSISSEAKALLERALAQSVRPKGARGAGGLGTRLKGLVSQEDWTDDFIQPRDQIDRAPPDFE